MTDTVNDQMRRQDIEEGRAMADRLAPKSIEAAAVLPDAEVAVFHPSSVLRGSEHV